MKYYKIWIVKSGSIAVTSSARNEWLVDVRGQVGAKRSIHLVKRRKRVSRVEIPWKTISLRPVHRPQYIQGRSRPIEWLEFVDSRVQQTEGTLSLSIHLPLPFARPFLLAVTSLVFSLCLASLLSLSLRFSLALDRSPSYSYACTVSLITSLSLSLSLSPTHVYFTSNSFPFFSRYI